MSIKSKDKWTSAEVVKLIRRKYSGQDYASFEQVADGTGRYAQSWIDVAAFGLWPSKGLHRMAFEVKISRGDYLNEVQNPNKNAWAKECFHEFWYVAPSGVIKDVTEVPEGCGWMQATRGGLRVKRQATVKKDAVMDDSLFASLCRSAQQELINAKRSVIKDALAEDPSYQTAKQWEEAVRRFLEIRNAETYPHGTVDEKLSLLSEATVESQARVDRDHVLSELSHFQTKMLELSDLYSALGLVSLLQCDELGKHIHAHWGGEDISSIAAKRQLSRARSRKRDDYRKNEAKRFTDRFDRLLQRAKDMIKGVEVGE